MVVEFLTFEVGAALRDHWIERDEAVWTTFLEDQPGFVHKEVWTTDDEPDTVRLVIWWASPEHWEAVDPARVAAVDAGLGSLAVAPAGPAQAFTVARSTPA
ncbi:MAG: TIGR03792 family protein [Acidimicrobiales bacterium]